jgi:GDP-D-mannose dehydratase
MRFELDKGRLFEKGAYHQLLQGDASKARRKLKWAPEISFERLIEDMVESDMEWHRK